MKRFVLSLLLLSLLVPLEASAARRMSFRTVHMRTTTAVGAVNATLKTWYDGGGGSSRDFADSVVFRKGVASRLVVDTTEAFAVSAFAFPPTFEERGGGYGSRAQALLGMQNLPGGTDSSIVDSTDATPWVIIRVRADSTSYANTLPSTMDSIAVGAQISYDGGVTWFSVSGTPTRIYYANATGISGDDGIAIPMITTAEISLPQDAAAISLQCQPSIWAPNAAPILNRTLCVQQGALVRFIVSVLDGQGQFAVDLGTWTE